MIKELDRKIIQELQKDGRASYNKLASDLGVSASTVSRRIENLIESKMIAIRALPNPNKLNFSANALITINCDLSEISNISHQMEANFYVNNIQIIFGRFDILIMVYFPTWEMLHRFINKELFGIDGVKDAEIYFIKDIKKRYAGIFKNSSLDEKPMSIRPFDQKLIEALVHNGRSNVKDLAQQFGVHESMVSRRLSFLLQKDIIRICAVTNPEALGRLANAMIILEMEPDELENVCSKLDKVPEIHLIMTMLKGNRVIVGIHSESNKLLFQVIKERIHTIKGIKETETFIRAQYMKRYYG